MTSSEILYSVTFWHIGKKKDSFVVQGHVPLIELPPLSPGIQAKVMEEVEVVETVRRGWSGGTEEETQRVNGSVIPKLKYPRFFLRW